MGRMSIEEEFFRRKRFVVEKMEKYGFRRSEGAYSYVSDFMDGDFRAVLTVTEKAAVRGKVIDNMNEEEYVQLRSDSFNGAYVNSVRAAYGELLSKIAGACCRDVLFASDQANRIAELIFERYSVHPDFPWAKGPYKSYGAFRHEGSNRWFALIMDVKWDVLLKNGNEAAVNIINLKTDPSQSDELCKKKGIYPGYHMNYKNWISAVLNEQLSDDDIMSMVDSSFRMTG